MDPHMSSALNQPPPAHNMSGPPQHPAHGLPMGQPIAPRVQQGFMSPRPAHTGSPVLLQSKVPQPPANIGSKPIQGGSSSPKPSLASCTSVQDKPMVAGSLKATAPTAGLPTAPSNASVGAAKGPIISSLIQTNASKSVHTLPQPQYQQQNLLHQQQQQHHQQRHIAMQHMQQQPLTVTQQMQVNQQQQQQHLQHPQLQMQEHQQQSHHLHPPHQQTTQQHQLQHQSQLSTHSTPTLQQHNQPFQAKSAAHNLVGTTKQETNKGQTPPVPDLISIKQTITHSVPTSTAKPVLFGTSGASQNQTINSKPYQQPISNNSSVAISSLREAQTVNSSSFVHSGNSSGFPLQSGPQKPLDTPKTVSIIPAKPTSQKGDVNKPSDGNNTVTITPSVKPNESQEQKSNSNCTSTPKTNTDANMIGPTQSTVHLAQNQNGIPPKPVTSVGNKTEQGVAESKVVQFTCSPDKPVSVSSVPQDDQVGLPIKNNQQSPVKVSQSVSAPSPKHPHTQGAASTKNASIKSTSSLLNNQTESSVPQPSDHGSQTKLPVSSQSQQKSPVQLTPKTAPVHQTQKPPASQKLPASVSTSPSQSSTPPKQAPASQKSVIGTAVSRSSNVTSQESTSNVQPTSKKLSEKAKIETMTKSEEATETQTKTLPKSNVGKLSRTRKPEKKESSRVPDKEETEFDEDSSTVADNATSKRTPRTPRRAAPEPHDDDGERRSKRPRNPAPVYQSPIPDSLSRLTKRLISTPKSPQEKLVFFFKNEHVALRNAEGTFYLCQIVQNVYKSTRKIKIRWLTPSLEGKVDCETYKPDYYDVTDFDCILTSVALEKSDQKSIVRLPAEEKTRILNILRRAIDRDKGLPLEKSELSEDHPDGLDLSLYNDEAQLKKNKGKQRKRKRKPDIDDSEDEEEEEEEDEEEDEDEEPAKKVASVDRTNSPLPRGRPAATAPSTPSQPPAIETPAPVTPIPRPRRGSRGFGSSRSVNRSRAAPDQKAESCSSPLPKPDPPAKEVSEDTPRNQRAARSAPKATASPKPSAKSVLQTKVSRRTRK